MTAAAVLAALSAAFTAQPGFTQDHFAIGFWVDPPMDEKAGARYREIAEANFTLVIGGFGAQTEEEVRRQLELCEQFGLAAIVKPWSEDLTELPVSPACWGYLVDDEPSVPEFPPVAAKVEAIQEARPDRFGYVNLFPSYASPWGQLGAETYDEYVRIFLETVDARVLSMDHYPYFRPEHDTRDAYCDDLAVMRKYALEAGIPFWNFFNIMPFSNHTDPTEEQVRWQIFQSLAYGAKGVLYFCYYTPPGDEFKKGGAIIRRDDTRTRHWYDARRINEQIKNLGSTLMKLTSTGVYRIAPGEDPAQVLDGSPLLDVAVQEGDPPHDLLVGAFAHEDGRRAVLINNYRTCLSAWLTVTFDAPMQEVREVDRWSGEEVPLLDESPNIEGMQLSLDAGAGRLFLLPAEE